MELGPHDKRVYIAVSKHGSQTTQLVRELHDRIGASVAEARKELGVHPRYPAILIIDNHSTRRSAASLTPAPGRGKGVGECEVPKSAGGGKGGGGGRRRSSAHTNTVALTITPPHRGSRTTRHPLVGAGGVKIGGRRGRRACR